MKLSPALILLRFARRPMEQAREKRYREEKGSTVSRRGRWFRPDKPDPLPPTRLFFLRDNSR